LADEGALRDRDWRLDLGCFKPPSATPLTFGDSVFTIGAVTDLVVLPAGTLDGAQGRALVGTGVLYNHALARSCGERS
jgi:hypothetical protein